VDASITAGLVAAGLGLDYQELRLDLASEAWLAAGAGLRERVAGLLADYPAEVELIGSAAVPGLLAKPIIDLAVGIAPGSGPAGRGVTNPNPAPDANPKPAPDASPNPAPDAAPVPEAVAVSDAGLLPAAVLASLVTDGWIYRGDAGSDGGQVFVLETRPWHRVAHLHLVERGGEQWRNYLRLRDLLGRCPEARARYQATKLRLAGRQPTDRRAYTSGKTGVVTELLASSCD
jgi:GrpB-like predicted nucleotidyltransferase (UPF0157 family)